MPFTPRLAAPALALALTACAMSPRARAPTEPTTGQPIMLRAQ